MDRVALVVVKVDTVVSEPNVSIERRHDSEVLLPEQPSLATHFDAAAILLKDVGE